MCVRLLFTCYKPHDICVDETGLLYHIPRINTFLVIVDNDNYDNYDGGDGSDDDDDDDAAADDDDDDDDYW